MNKLLSDYQFCQMENDLLRQQLKTLKMDINSMTKDVTELFKKKELLAQLQDGSIMLAKEDQQNLLQIIHKVIKTN